MRSNHNKNDTRDKTAMKEKSKTLDVSSLLIEIRLCRKYGEPVHKSKSNQHLESKASNKRKMRYLDRAVQSGITLG